jgi:hypothetical protein
MTGQLRFAWVAGRTERDSCRVVHPDCLGDCHTGSDPIDFL